MEKISFEKIISIENLLGAWEEFLRGKRDRKDVQNFQLHCMDNIISLHHDLKNQTYVHGGYEMFTISDPKQRTIHKASVRDRLLHHAIYRVLYQYFDTKFIHDSYSCRNNKGTHKAIERFHSFARKVSKNWTKQCWVLKCDVRKFFASIDQDILIIILEKNIEDRNIIWLLRKVIQSFSSTQRGKGLPLGNLTSQLLVNVYMNEFDHCVKQVMKIPYYIRYADDFVILSQDKYELEIVLNHITLFLHEVLGLTLHPNKVSIQTYSSGIDFLGWVNFPRHRVLRTVTKRRMLKKLFQCTPSQESAQSYLGMLGHGNSFKIRSKIIIK